MPDGEHVGGCAVCPRSSLQELFLPENADILEIIRTGAESLLGEPEQKLEEESGAPADPAVTSMCLLC